MIQCFDPCFNVSFNTTKVEKIFLLKWSAINQILRPIEDISSILTHAVYSNDKKCFTNAIENTWLKIKP